MRRQPIEEEKEDELRRQPIEEEEEELQAKATSDGISEVNPDIESHIQNIRGGGQPLPESTRAFFEPRFGNDFSQVRVHADAKAAESAQAVNARAFTVGKDVIFGAGQYSETSAGQKLLAHELTHVVQQESSVPNTIRRMSYGDGAPPPRWVQDYNACIVPDKERENCVNEAIGMIREVVNDPESYPRCNDFFHRHCPGGAVDSFAQMFIKAILWKADRPSALAFASVSGDNVAYTQAGYNSGPRNLAVTLVHELMHNCGITGVDEHYLADVAGLYCIGNVNVFSVAGGPVSGADVPYLIYSYRRFLADLGNGRIQLSLGADINLLSMEMLDDPDLSGEFGSILAGLRLRGLENVETGERTDWGGERFGGVTLRLEAGASLGRFRVTEERDHGTGRAAELGPGFVVQAGLGAEFYIPAGVSAIPLSLGLTYRMVQPLNTEAERIHGLLFELGYAF